MHPTFMLYDKYLDQNYSEVKRCAYPYIRLCDWQHTHPQRNTLCTIATIENSTQQTQAIFLFGGILKLRRQAREEGGSQMPMLLHKLML